MKDLFKSKTISLFLIVLLIYTVSFICDKVIPDTMTSLIQVLFPSVAIKESHKKYVESKQGNK